MEYPHKSVLLAEVSQQLNCSNGRTIVDCTLGGAGHSETILNLITPDGFLIGIDQDDAVIEAAKVRLARFSQHFLFIKGNFADIDRLLPAAGVTQVDGFLLDLGLSSMQLADSSRGFSYQVDAPLDMRFNTDRPLTAADILNSYSQAELARIIKTYGEERWAGRIAAFIVSARKRQAITRTGQLVELVKSAIPAAARRAGGHPARRTFQALRIEVNQELESLNQALDAMPKWLNAGGRIVVISYHSLEDRLVKRKFKELATGCVCPPELAVCVCERRPVLRIVTGKPIFPSEREIEENPRARSARLRAAEKVKYADR
jgi:16S rRNA (cytosine1402-N4)-methyltransferase